MFDPENPIGATGLHLQQPSLADAMTAIVGDPGLPRSRKQAWATALRSLAWAIGRPPESLPCRIVSLRPTIAKLNAASLGWSEKTLANHKSNVRAALDYFMRSAGVPRRGAALSPGWASLIPKIADTSPRRLLGAFARYCSMQQIGPEAVTGETFEAYMGFRVEATFSDTSLAYRRSLIRAWNGCVGCIEGWPASPIAPPAMVHASMGLAWEAFPEGLRRDLDTYLKSLSVPHRGVNGKRWRGAKASTLVTRRTELVAFARKAVQAGIDPARLTSLQALLAPDVLEKTFEAYLPEDGDPVRVYVIDLAWKLLSLARAIGADTESIERLEELKSHLETERGSPLTEKNLAVIRLVLTTDIWSRVIALPELLMRQAQRSLNRHPRKAKSLATAAVQMAILTYAPIRSGNLLSIQLEHHLKRLPSGSYRLHFPAYDVKNRVDLDFELQGTTAAILDTYINMFRPLLEGKNRSDWLFPARTGRNRSRKSASKTIARLVEKHIGQRITAHQFRHAAVAMILKAEPGNYEFARRVLGHRTIATTQRFYAGLESFVASKAFGNLVEVAAAKANARPKTKRQRGLQP